MQRTEHSNTRENNSHRVFQTASCLSQQIISIVAMVKGGPCLGLSTMPPKQMRTCHNGLQPEHGNNGDIMYCARVQAVPLTLGGGQQTSRRC